MNVLYEPKGRAREYSLLAVRGVYTGCRHGCWYCFMLDMPGADPVKFAQVRPDERALHYLKLQAAKYYDTDKRCLLSFSSDPYPVIDQQTNLTRRCLQILSAHKIPFQILTKGGLRAIRDFDLYGLHDAFACTLTTLDEAQAAAWEPHAAPPDHRLKALQAAKNKGITTWLSLEPLLDVDQAFQIIRETAGYVDLYKIGPLNHKKQTPVPDLFDAGLKLLEFLDLLKKPYYLKSDLAKYLKGIPFRNTDTRIVNKNHR